MFSLSRLLAIQVAVGTGLGILFPISAKGAEGKSLRGADASRKGVTMYYSFRSKSGGGLAEVRIGGDGAIVSHQPVFQDRRLKYPWKIAVSENGRWVAMTAEQANLNNLLIYDRVTGEGHLRSVPRELDAVEAWGNRFVMGANNGVIYLFDPATDELHRYNLRQNTYPPVRKAEYLHVLGDELWITVQKDSRQQATKGSRVIVFDLNRWAIRHDLLMARDRPDLELVSFRERGPSPEIVVPDEKSNTLLLSMDRYGGVALADLDAARQGGWRNRSIHSTDPSGRWGIAFPDRWRTFDFRGKTYVLIANSGPQGGVALVDLAGRKIVATAATPPGLENPVWLPHRSMLVAGCPGKTKFVRLATLHEKRQPHEGGFVLQLEDAGSEIRIVPRHLPIQLLLERAVSLGKNSDLVAFQGKDNIAVVNVVTGKVLDSQPVIGSVARIAATSVNPSSK